MNEKLKQLINMVIGDQYKIEEEYINDFKRTTIKLNKYASIFLGNDMGYINNTFVPSYISVMVNESDKIIVREHIVVGSFGTLVSNLERILKKYSNESLFNIEIDNQEVIYELRKITENENSQWKILNRIVTELDKIYYISNYGEFIAAKNHKIIQPKVAKNKNLYYILDRKTFFISYLVLRHFQKDFTFEQGERWISYEDGDFNNNYIENLMY